VVKQCVATEGVEPEYIRAEVLPEFFRCFWQRRMALDRRNYRALVETTVEVANKVRGPAAGACMGLRSAQWGMRSRLRRAGRVRRSLAVKRL
jgi:hypothetical protein